MFLRTQTTLEVSEDTLIRTGRTSHGVEVPATPDVLGNLPLRAIPIRDGTGRMYAQMTAAGSLHTSGCPVKPLNTFLNNGSAFSRAGGKHTTVPAGETFGASTVSSFSTDKPCGTGTTEELVVGNDAHGECAGSGRAALDLNIPLPDTVCGPPCDATVIPGEKIYHIK
jgi:hypothetical protein